MVPKEQTKCPKCQAENIKKNGSRQTQNRGKIQRYNVKNAITDLQRTTASLE